jgi:hypothetical protein
MSSVAGPFPKHDLSKVNEELRNHDMYGHYVANDILPDYVGGSKVHLLLGITLTAQPTHLFTLESGISVFRSPFKDIFGSDICYGGSHESFKGSKLSPETNHAVLFLNTMESVMMSVSHATSDTMKVHNDTLTSVMDYDSDDGMVKPSNTQYSIMIDSEAHISVFPSALTEKDFKDANDSTTGNGNDESQVLHQDSIDPLNDEISSHSCSAHKASVPIARLREIIDQDDTGNIVSYRCPNCSKCLKCKESGKIKAVTLQESVEQAIIEKSVTIDKEKRKVFVDLPFIKDPVPFLTQRHHASDNYKSARQVYNQQCRKPELHKVEMRKAHAELVNKGYMKKLSDFDAKAQEKIIGAPFRHYYPWRTVEKTDSVSTPIRMVVDPTMTGLNLILAKGENRLGKMNEILIRNRTKTHAWTSDISKMYNQLQLNEESYPYSLFLYHSSLDPSAEPEIWVMVVAWYGVVPTGNQAGFAIEEVAYSAPPEFQIAKDALLKDRFVDDLAPGQLSDELRDEQISKCRELLGTAGFSLKFVAKSGEPPCSKASSDGVSLKMLGYVWVPESDILSPGISELNFNKKVRGAKKPNSKPVITMSDAEELVASTKLTRKMVASKVAELYDPVGIWEPLKLQLKLGLSKLNSLDWDEMLSSSDQLAWKDRLVKFVEFPAMKVDRCVIPQNAIISKGARLICISDAATHAGGAAIYIGFYCTDGSFSNKLLTAKSKLMSATVPRNELSAILLMTEMAYIVSKALEGMITQILYITDSTIALSWCHNINKRLRLYVHSRVESIRRMIEWTLDSTEELPLFHIDGRLNIADLLTKEHDVSTQTLDQKSEWQSGSCWMSLPIEEMPLTKYSKVKLDTSKEAEAGIECYQEPFSMSSVDCHMACTRDVSEVYVDTIAVTTQNLLESHYEPEGQLDASNGSVFLAQAGAARGKDDFLVDMIALGWQRGRSTIAIWIKFIHRSFHKLHISKGKDKEERCLQCTHQKNSSAEMSSALLGQADRYLFRTETDIILRTTTEYQRRKFVMKDKVLMYTGRLAEENQFTTRDLDTKVFFDSHEFTGLCPVVMSHSSLCFSFLMHVHMKVRPHAGVEVTLKEVAKRMHIPDSPRKIVKAIRNDCVKCRIIFKKTLELEMSKHHASRTMLAPIFYNCQMDVVFGFKGQSFKRSRSTLKVYALVIVCLMSSATSILAMEGMETQDVILAIERHSARHGVPAELFVDNGSQLIALKSAKFSIRDLDTYMYDSVGMRITVSSPKAHEERGRVEAKVKQVRSLLERTGVDTDVPMTVIQWETVFSKVASALDDLPLAKGHTSNASDSGFDIITPNRLKLGRNNNRSLMGSIEMQNAALPSDILDRNRKITSAYLQILIDRIHHFQHRPEKWLKNSDVPPKVNDTVLFVFKDGGNIVSQSKAWKLGRIVHVTGTKVRIMYPNKSDSTKIPTWRFTERNWREVSIIMTENELYTNSNEYFESIREDANLQNPYYE